MFENLIGSKKIIPKHIAITTEGIEDHSIKNSVSIKDSFDKSKKIIKDMITEMIRLDIRIFTIYMISENMKSENHFENRVDFVYELLSELKKNELIINNQVKVSVLGKWYDLPSRAVEEIKEITSETKDFDKFFLNFCINYDGQEEIVDACKLIVRRVLSQKATIETINKELIKENLYSSYFIPPEIIIKPRKSNKMGGLLLYDSMNSFKVTFGRTFPELSKNSIEAAIKAFNTAI